MKNLPVEEKLFRFFICGPVYFMTSVIKHPFYTVINATLFNDTCELIGPFRRVKFPSGSVILWPPEDPSGPSSIITCLASLCVFLSRCVQMKCAPCLQAMWHDGYSIITPASVKTTDLVLSHHTQRERVLIRPFLIHSGSSRSSKKQVYLDSPLKGDLCVCVIRSISSPLNTHKHNLHTS